jgi:hypothetical protein
MLQRSQVAAAFLNDNPAEQRERRQVQSEQRRVLDLLEVCRALQARVEKVAPARRSRSSSPQADLRVQQLLGSANAMLARYKSVPVVSVPYAPQKSSTCQLIASQRAELSRGGAYDTRLRSETNVVRLLMEMLNADLLDRLQTCDCGKWFVALRKNSKSCSGPSGAGAC